MHVHISLCIQVGMYVRLCVGGGGGYVKTYGVINLILRSLRDQHMLGFVAGSTVRSGL